MQGKLSVACFKLNRAITIVVDPTVATLDLTLHALDGLTRNPVVDRVDDPANRISPVHQCGRTAQDLDSISRERILRHGVIVRQRGCVQRPHTVLQQPDPITVHASDDRAPNHWAVGGGRHTGQTI